MAHACTWEQKITLSLLGQSFSILKSQCYQHIAIDGLTIDLLGNCLALDNIDKLHGRLLMELFVSQSWVGYGVSISMLEDTFETLHNLVLAEVVIGHS